MLRRTVAQASPWRSRPICLFCAARCQTPPSLARSFHATDALQKRQKRRKNPPDDQNSPVRRKWSGLRVRKILSRDTEKDHGKPSEDAATTKDGKHDQGEDAPKSLKEALLGKQDGKKASKKAQREAAQLQIQKMYPGDLNFEPVPVEVPPVPMLSYGLDRVLFNPGVYLLQDRRSRVYNFDPYLEKVMPVHEFNFDALSEYKTSSKDQDLLDLTKKLKSKFTGSTSSMSGVLQHFHYILSSFRELNHDMLSRSFPATSKKFSKITFGPDAIFLRKKDDIYAIDADKTYDRPNIMSWLGHSLEKLLTSERSEFELFRRSNPDNNPPKDESSRCYHYSTLGNILMRSQLDAHDPRLPGTGVFDLKTRAVVSIRMNHKEYESGSGYQLRFAQGEWESFEREFYDMTRATMLKYSLQVRMGRMDGIFVAYHNIERIFGFQYLSLADMDKVLHGQDNTTLGDQEFRLSVGLLDEILTKATAQFPDSSIRMHFESRDAKTPFMYIFAEPVTEEQAEEIQTAGDAAQKEFARTVVGLGKDDPEVQEAWQSIQEKVDEQVDDDTQGKLSAEAQEEAVPNEQCTAEVSAEETTTNASGETTKDTPEEATETTEPTKTTEAAETTKSTETPATNDEGQTGGTAEEESAPEEDRPVMGWTLTVRNKVNGHYVNRPKRLDDTDEWSIEYNLQEIPEKSRWRTYKATKARRRSLVTNDEKEVDTGLQRYRDLIQRYSNRGRAWREEQDKINAEFGTQLFKPLGPGSDAAAATSASEVDAEKRS